MFEKKEKVTLRVLGMSCGHCEKKVSDALCGLKGVKKAFASKESGTAEVEYAPSKVSVAQMLEAINDLGFEASEG